MTVTHWKSRFLRRLKPLGPLDVGFRYYITKKNTFKIKFSTSQLTITGEVLKMLLDEEQIEELMDECDMVVYQFADMVYDIIKEHT